MNIKRSAAVALLLLVAASTGATEMKIVTEYRYPTEYEVTPVMGTTANGQSTIIGAIVTPTRFEMREVGVIMNAEATIMNRYGKG